MNPWTVDSCRKMEKWGTDSETLETTGRLATLSENGYNLYAKGLSQLSSLNQVTQVKNNYLAFPNSFSFSFKPDIPVP